MESSTWLLLVGVVEVTEVAVLVDIAHLFKVKVLVEGLVRSLY
jgi:hypothetical protein